MSSSSATIAVDKAISDLLIGPDWNMNIDICDSINSHRWQAKYVVKALKKCLQHRNPKVNLLALTLLETMVKNCGDIVHFRIADMNILLEMIKFVRKKMDMHVRDPILVLLDFWKEAFDGAGGKYPQYIGDFMEFVTKASEKMQVVLYGIFNLTSCSKTSLHKSMISEFASFSDGKASNPLFSKHLKVDRMGGNQNEPAILTESYLAEALREVGKLEDLKQLVDPKIDTKTNKQKMVVKSHPSSDIVMVNNKCKKAEQWLRDRTQHQDSLPKSTDPPLGSNEIKAKTKTKTLDT